ncbi:MAG TPA: class I SAM-dependent methyltransferase [Chloroflexota bacterium]
MANDVVNEGYETAADADTANRNQFSFLEYVAGFANLIERGKTILDVGCGDGIPVDEYLVNQGFALNGIDISERKIELARNNIPDGFYEVKDMLALREGEYCVDGVISLRAMLHVPHKSYHALLRKFASFMSNGGAVLLVLRPDEWGGAEEVFRSNAESGSQDGAENNTESLEGAGFTIIVNEIDGPADEKHQIVLARS